MRIIETDLTGSLVDTRKAVLTISKDSALINGHLVERKLNGGFSVNHSLRLVPATEVSHEVGRRRGPFAVNDNGEMFMVIDPVNALASFIQDVADWHPADFDPTIAQVAAEMGLTYAEVADEIAEAKEMLAAIKKA